jgi:hypothetical protein
MIALLVTPGSTEALTALKIVAAIVWFAVMVRMMASTTDDLEQLAAQAVIDALHAARISRKEAAALMGLDEAQLNRQLRAEPMNHLSLFRLLRMATSTKGVVFWAVLTPALGYLIAQRRLEEISDCFRRRA